MRKLVPILILSVVFALPLFGILPALAACIGLYHRFLMPRRFDITKRTRRAVAAFASICLWIASFLWPIAYGKAWEWELKLGAGLLQFHGGEIPTTFSAMQYHTYEMEDGFYRPSEGAISWATRPELARLLPGGIALPWAMILPPSYRDFRGGFAWHIPLWPFFGLPIACWCVETWRLRRFLRKGLCPSCGYDMRGGGDRCPECGANVPTAMVSAHSKCELREREADGDVSPRPPHG